MKSTNVLLFLLYLLHPVIVTGQLNGNYTIDSGMPASSTNFQSFTAFSNALSASGISGNVIATVAPGSGPYSEQVVFSGISGSGPAAIVTIEGSGETITAITSSTDRHVVRLSDVQYFNINNLHIQWNPLSTGGFYGIHIFNSGHHISITNCSVDISGTNSTLYGAYVASGSLTSILDSGVFSNLTFMGDTAQGGGYGVSVFGTASNLATQILIAENVFYDFHSNGVYLRETNGALIRNNYLEKRTSNITSCNAIQIAQNANINAIIHSNFITVSQTNNGTVTFRGIYLFNGTGHRVFNNVIYNIRLISGNVTGIEVRTGGTAPEIYFNTISMDNSAGTSGNLFGIKEELSNTNSVLRNNLISISQTTSGLKAGLSIGAIATPATAFNSDYNLFWIPGGNVAIRNATTPVLYSSLAAWQSASGQDMNSASMDPVFISALQVIPTNPLADNLGIPIPGITTDVLGAMRSATPDIGAYEFPASTAIAESLSGIHFNIFPNPFSDHLSIQTRLNGEYEFRLFNTSGALIRLLKFSNSAEIKTNDLSPGIYFYELKSGSKLTGAGKLFRNYLD